jgi:hypothetical protein
VELIDDLVKLQAEIGRYMPYDDFVRIHRRLSGLRAEEEAKLKALADLQKMYLAANSDAQREAVKEMVGKIRELSRQHRQEMRSLNDEIQQKMPFHLAAELYQRLLAIDAAG